jgi:formaldehyde-activating enzyme involved in methanogenesis
MTIILQKSDLASNSFANTNSNGAGGVALRTDAGSAFRAELALNTGAGLVGFIQPGAGAVPRTLQSKGEDVLSVKDYASLQEAVNAAVATNGRLHVPAGIYGRNQHYDCGKFNTVW